MSIRLYCLALACFVFLILAGCCCKKTKLTARPEIFAYYCEEPIVVDGQLNEKCWSTAQIYFLSHFTKQWISSHPDNVKTFRNGVVEQSRIRLLWNKNYLYVGAELTDSDVVALLPKNQEKHFDFGDVFEVFLKPLDHNFYWEFHSTPNENKSALFFMSRGRRLPEGFKRSALLNRLKVACRIEGTLNNPNDKDKKWVTEIRVPLSEIEHNGVNLFSDATWTILFSRYNYSAYLPDVELSSYPVLGKGSFHRYEDYGILRLQK